MYVIKDQIGDHPSSQNYHKLDYMTRSKLDKMQERGGHRMELTFFPKLECALFLSCI